MVSNAGKYALTSAARNLYTSRLDLNLAPNSAEVTNSYGIYALGGRLYWTLGKLSILAYRFFYLLFYL